MNIPYRIPGDARRGQRPEYGCVTGPRIGGFVCNGCGAFFDSQQVSGFRGPALRQWFGLLSGGFWVAVAVLAVGAVLE